MIGNSVDALEAQWGCVEIRIKSQPDVLDHVAVGTVGRCIWKRIRTSCRVMVVVLGALRKTFIGFNPPIQSVCRQVQALRRAVSRRPDHPLANTLSRSTSPVAGVKEIPNAPLVRRSRSWSHPNGGREMRGNLFDVAQLRRRINGANVDQASTARLARGRSFAQPADASRA